MISDSMNQADDDKRNPYICEVTLLNGQTYFILAKDITTLKLKIACEIKTINLLITLLHDHNIVDDEELDYFLKEQQKKDNTNNDNKLYFQCIHNTQDIKKLIMDRIFTRSVIDHLHIKDYHIIEWLNIHYSHSKIKTLLYESWQEAAIVGFIDVIYFFLQKDKDTTLHSKEKDHVALQKAYTICISIFGKKRFDINYQDDVGHTAVQLASLWGHLPIVQILIKSGANLNCGCNPLQSTLTYNWPDIITLLIKNKIDVNRVYNGETPLTELARFGYIKQIKQLLDASEDINVHKRDAYGFTALENAEWQGFTEIVNILKGGYKKKKKEENFIKNKKSKGSVNKKRDTHIWKKKEVGDQGNISIQFVPNPR